MGRSMPEFDKRFAEVAARKGVDAGVIERHVRKETKKAKAAAKEMLPNSPSPSSSVTPREPNPDPRYDPRAQDAQPAMPPPHLEAGANDIPAAPGESTASPAAPASNDPHYLPGFTLPIKDQKILLGKRLFPLELARSLSATDTICTTVIEHYLTSFSKDSGWTGDAVEKGLLDAIAFANLRVARLHAMAERIAPVELKKLYSNTAIKLQGETSKSVLALVTYRKALGEAAGRARASDDSGVKPTPKRRKTLRSTRFLQCVFANSCLVRCYDFTKWAWHQDSSLRDF